jgi:hypothetical protein
MEYQLSRKTLYNEKYYRFRRRRKSIFYVYDPKSKKKSDYIIRTGRSEMLESGFFYLRIRFGALYIKLGKDMLLPKIKGKMIKWSAMQTLFKNANMT